jgi:hypothetical protein
VSECVREDHRTGVGWVEPRFIEARPTVRAEALGGPHAALRRSTHPTTGALATYPEPRIAEQAVRDMAQVYMDRRVLPEVLVLVLHPRGQQQAAESAALRSARGWTRWDVGWKVIELWTVAAEDLLAAGDVGLIPWVPLSRFEGPPEPMLSQCRARIDRDAPPEEHENLLAVTQVLAGLRYNDPRLFQLLGGRKAMIESPVLQELKAEWTRRCS